MAVAETNTFTTSIANGATDSAQVDISGRSLCGVFLPAAFDGTALTFKVSPTLGGTDYVLHNGTADYSLTVAASKYIALDPRLFQGVRYVKLVSGTSQTGATAGIALVVKQDV